MNILLIGATGFIGPHVVRGCLENGHRVAVFSRGKMATHLPPSVQRIHGDRDRLPGFRSEFEQFAPDVVLDMIPFTQKQAQGLISTFKGIAARIVAVSSADVYRNYGGLWGKEKHGPDPTPLKEDAPLRQELFPYRGVEKIPLDCKDDYEKILVERTVLSDPDVAGTVLRLPAVYGPGDRHHRLWPYLKRMRDGRRAIILERHQASWRWTRGYVENVAAAIVLALTDERARGRTYNLGEQPAPTETEWVKRLGKAAGWTGRVVTLSASHIPHHLKTDLKWQYHLETDTARIGSELGCREIVPRMEGVGRALQWEWENPPENFNQDIFNYVEEDRILEGQV